jgi:hypothetical protein
MNEARPHIRMRLNEIVRRPGVYGRDETAECLLLEAMAAVDNSLPRWEAEFAGLKEHGAFSSTGVRGAYQQILPDNALRGATCSMYAEIAHRCGWLDLDRACSKPEFQRLSDEVGDWVTQDRTLSELTETFGRPSLWIGGTNAFYPKTLSYGTADPGDPLVSFHLWNTFAAQVPGEPSRGVHPEPVVLAVRHRPGDFPGSFSFTPLGVRNRDARARESPLRDTAWIFEGTAVFRTVDAALQWAAERGVTGTLAERFFGGADEEPSRIHLTNGRPDRDRDAPADG